MNDLEKLLRSGLHAAADSYQSPDPVAARQRFQRRRRMRWITVGASGVAAAGVAAFAFFALGPSALEEVIEGDVTVTTRPVVTATISVGLGPSGVAAAEGEVWTANVSDASVSRIDAGAGKVIEYYPVGGRPEDVVVGDGAVWVANQTEIQRLDPETGEHVDIPIEAHPSHIDLAMGDGALYTFSGDDNVTMIDTETNKKVARVSVVEQPGDIAFGAGYVWVLGDAGRSLHRLHPKDLSGPSFEISGSTSDDNDLAVGGGAVWVAHGDAGLIYRVDPATGETTGPPGDVDGDFAGLAVGADSLWVLTGSSTDSDKLWRLGLEDADRVAAPIILGDSADVAVGDGAVWVTDISDDSVLRVDLVGGDAPSS